MSSDVLLKGVAHVTTRETLQRAPYFARLSHEAHGEIFIDRDGTHFRYILNHLRGECALPRDRHILEEMRIEASYYGLEQLRTKILSLLREKLDVPDLLADVIHALHHT